MPARAGDGQQQPPGGQGGARGKTARSQQQHISHLVTLKRSSGVSHQYGSRWLHYRSSVLCSTAKPRLLRSISSADTRHNAYAFWRRRRRALPLAAPRTALPTYHCSVKRTGRTRSKRATLLHTYLIHLPPACRVATNVAVARTLSCGELTIALNLLSSSYVCRVSLLCQQYLVLRAFTTMPTHTAAPHCVLLNAPQRGRIRFKRAQTTYR